MQELTVGIVLRLLAASDEPEDHLKKLFEWQIERVLTLVRLAVAGVAAVGVAVIAALLRENLAFDDIRVLVIVLGGVLAFVLGWQQYDEVKQLEAEYVAALGLLRELAPLVPFWRLYGVPHGG